MRERKQCDRSVFLYASIKTTELDANRPLEKAALPKIRFHDLRHEHATMMLKQEEHPKIVSERLGHSNTRITMDIYSHVLPNMQKEAVDDLMKAQISKFIVSVRRMLEV